jgi:hypothetical protein
MNLNPSGEPFALGLALSGLRCAATMFALSILPGALFLFYARRMATVESAWAAHLIGLSMGGVATLGLTFHCPTDHFLHLLLYHSVPLLVLGLSARWIIVRMLRW